MPDRLLDRQIRLLEHLTSGTAIFGADPGALTNRTRHGFHGGLLHLEARLSHAKRMDKIEWVLTRTLALLGNSRAPIIRDFVEACPPSGISWLENARQFHQFLSARWRCEAPQPPYLSDIAAYELAYATVRAGETREAAESQSELAAPGAIRRHPSVVLLRCAHDIRPILEGRDGQSAPRRRDIWLALALPPASDEPLASELSRDLFEFLEMIDQFTDPAIFDDTPGVDTLIADLAARALLEVRV